MSYSCHILLVDDEDFIRSAGVAMLEMIGHRATAVSSGEEAIRLYRALGDGIDAVIIDFSMPDMNGGDCYRALKAINPAVKAFLTTGYLMDGKIRALLDEGMAGMIQKPFSLASLREALNDLPAS